MAKLSKELPEDVLRQMHDYYSKLLSKYKDVVTVQEIVTLTGYAKPQSIIGATVGSLNRSEKDSSFTYRKSSSSTFSVR